MRNKLTITFDKPHLNHELAKLINLFADIYVLSIYIKLRANTGMLETSKITQLFQ